MRSSTSTSKQTAKARAAAIKPPQYVSWLAIAMLAWSVGLVYNVFLGGEAYWLKRLYWQKRAIASEISEPKLMITGGSGAHYTVNSKQLSAELGRPVVNFGLDGPLGLDVILSSTLESVKPGDVVLLVPEYLILQAADAGFEEGYREKSGMFVLAIGEPRTGEVPAKQLALNLIQLGVPSLRWTVKAVGDLAQKGRFTGYYDGPLTPQGDPIETKPREGDWWSLQVQPASAHAIARIAQFKIEVEERGGRLVLAAPWFYSKDPTEQTLDNIDRIIEQLEAIAPVLVDEDSLNIQRNAALFADTHYHLKPEGRELRSQQLAQQLEPLLTESE